MTGWLKNGMVIVVPAIRICMPQLKVNIFISIESTQNQCFAWADTNERKGI